LLSNPPFGVEWKKIEKEIRKRPTRTATTVVLVPTCRASADGSLLFPAPPDFQDARPPRRVAAVLVCPGTDPPLFTGGAGSGESEIRRYVLENDLSRRSWPAGQTCSTTRDRTYVWIVQQPQAGAPQRQAATDRRQRLLAEDAQEPGEQAQGTQPSTLTKSRACSASVSKQPKDGAPISRLFKNEEFGYRTITVERSERATPKAKSC